MLLTIIIPAYNVENYIKACLDSCLRQEAFVKRLDSERRDMEIIVIDDGSTDSTPALLAQYAERHASIKVVRQENQGQSVARNRAIEMAQGDYIYMVDADDEMTDQSLPYDKMLSDRYDIIGVQVMYEQADGKRRPWSHQMERWPFDQDFLTGASFVKNHNIEGLVYGYVFNREIFTRHTDLRFTPGIYHQDEELIFKIFTLARRVTYTRGYTYLYYERIGSSINTRTEERKRRLMDHHLIILHNLIHWSNRHGFEQVMHYKLSYLSMDMLRMLVRNRFDHNYVKQVIEDLRKLRLYPLPFLFDVKYLIMKSLTFSPELVNFWIRHPKISKKMGF